LTSDEVKYDLVQGPEYNEVMMDHLTRCARLDVREIYANAMAAKDQGGIIRAKRASDQMVLGSIVVVLKPDSRLARHIAASSQQVGLACISSPVISTVHSDRISLFQGLLLLAIRQFKKRPVRSILLDYVCDYDCEKNHRLTLSGPGRRNS
jgi:enhancing lycopene biosynthesis protein 2